MGCDTSDAEQTLRAQLAALTQVGLGVIALDRDGRAIAINAAVDLGDGLEIADARPRASHRSDQAALDAAIQQALPPATDALQPPKRVALRRPSGRRVLLVNVLPLPDAPAATRAAALMVITDLDCSRPPAIDELRTLFGLTRREAEFAALLATGVPPDRIAENTGISRLHARQRLKILLRKTETHRQGELVALLSRLQPCCRTGRPEGRTAAAERPQEAILV
jgi:DNA-binding CsgD family transcriptional regulator